MYCGSSASRSSASACVERVGGLVVAPRPSASSAPRRFACARPTPCAARPGRAQLGLGPLPLAEVEVDLGEVEVDEAHRACVEPRCRRRASVDLGDPALGDLARLVAVAGQVQGVGVVRVGASRGRRWSRCRSAISIDSRSRARRLLLAPSANSAQPSRLRMPAAARVEPSARGRASASGAASQTSRNRPCSSRKRTRWAEQPRARRRVASSASSSRPRRWVARLRSAWPSDHWQVASAGQHRGEPLRVGVVAERLDRVARRAPRRPRPRRPGSGRAPPRISSSPWSTPVTCSASWTRGQSSSARSSSAGGLAVGVQAADRGRRLERRRAAPAAGRRRRSSGGRSPVAVQAASPSAPTRSSACASARWSSERSPGSRSS